MHDRGLTGDFSITNSFMVRNQIGVAVQGATTVPTFAFNTIADNSSAGVACKVAGAAITGTNSIIARNATSVTGTDSPTTACTFPSTLITSDVAALKFKQADVAPYDYHLTAGSSAIDAADASSTTDHDYDGDPRPKGNGFDIGADEAF